MKELSEYRYPGCRSFQDTTVDRILFRGRTREKENIFHMVLVEKLVVLFAKSGIGKTSLINAGLKEPLREKKYIPFRITFTDPEETPIDAIYIAIKEAVDNENIDFKEGEKNTLWQYFKTAEFWSLRDELMIPVLVFDQFEELFTLHSQEERSEFIDQLADLIRGNIPQSVLDKISENESFPYNETPPSIKIVISIREDFLGLLEEMANKIPHILHNRFRLLRLTREQAREAIEEPAKEGDKKIKAKPFTFEDGAVKEMLGFLCRKKKPVEREHLKKHKIKSPRFLSWKRKSSTIPTNEAEPFQLQLLCQHFEKIVQNNPEKLKKADKEGDSIIISKADLGGESGMRRILKAYYRKQINENTWFLRRKKAYKLFEKYLVDKNDRRVSIQEQQIVQKAKIKYKVLENLVSGRLLRVEPRLDSYYYELSHDSLIEPIRKAQWERKTRKTILWGLIILLCLSFFGFYSIQEREFQKYNDALYMGSFRLLYGDPDKALEYFEKAAQLKGIDAELACQFGEAYEAKGNLNKAIDNYQKAIEKDNKYSDAFVGLGDVYRKLKKDDEAIENYKLALNNSSNKDAYIGLALLYIEKEAYEEALRLYEEAVKANYENAFIMYDLVDVLKIKGREKEIEEIYAIASVIDTKDPDYYFNLGYYFHEENKNKEAIENYQKAIQINPDDADAYYNLGLVYYNQANWKDAESNFQKAIQINPNDAEAYYNLGLIHYKQKNYKDAETNLQKVIQIIPDYAEAYYLLGLCYYEQKSYKDAESNLQKAIQENPNDADAYYLLGLYYYEQKSYKDAESNLHKAIQINPNYAEAYYLLGLYYYEQKNYKDAETNLQKAIQIIPDYYADAYYLLGLCYYEQKNYKDAETNLQKAIQIIPDYYADAHYLLGLYYYEQKNYKDAESNFHKAIQINTNYADAYYNLGLVYYNQASWKDAESNFHKAIQINTNYADAYYNLGLVYYNQANWKDAESNFHKAIQINPNDADANYFLGIIYCQQNNYEKAESRFLKAIEIDPKYEKDVYSFLGAGYFDNEKDYEKAYKIYKKLYELDPEDSSIISNFAEANLATDHFDMAVSLSNKVLKIQNISPEDKLTMDFISISSFVFQGKNNETSKRLREFIDYYRSLRSDYERNWSYNGTKNCIENSTKLTDSDRELLLNLIDVLESPKETGDIKINKIENQFFRTSNNGRQSR